jgi:hypothetical protein
MKKNANAKISCRPVEALKRIEEKYPRKCWQMVDQLRNDRGNEIPDWPSWCFLPLAGSMAVLSTYTNMANAVQDMALFGALASWRVTKGIYRFDPETYSAVLNTPVDGDIPCEILYRLPEWCVYLETPGMVYGDRKMHGFWAHLEFDTNDGRHELRIVADLDSEHQRFILHLGKWSLEEAIERMLAETNRMANLLGFPSVGDAGGKAELAKFLQPVLSLMLFLCSQASEIGDGHHGPKNPSTVRGGKFQRIFEAPKVKTWDVGVRMGAALRRAMQCASSNGMGGQGGNRVHIRRGHWQGFRSGPMKDESGTKIPSWDRKLELKWLYPIIVNGLEGDLLPATIRSVA